MDSRSSVPKNKNKVMKYFFHIKVNNIVMRNFFFNERREYGRNN
nr:MAG TPA: hypothetical protein [Caudoviricetes sp.]